MHTIGMSCRRGTSTILGTLIFIGIMFTAVIPMILVMRQADTFHEREKFEVGRLDEERSMEDIYFYLKPTVVDEQPILTLKISNKGELAVRITRVWINDDTRDDFDCIMHPISNMDLEFGGLIVPDPPEPVPYHVMAVTDRGNIFSPTSGIPTYDPSSKVWTMDNYVIIIIMEMPTHSLHISVVKGIDIFCDEDVPPWRNSYPISVTEEGTYHVTVYKFYGQNPQVILKEQDVSLSLLNPSEAVWVPA